MSNRKWRKGSVYGDGPRRPLDRNQRARWTYRVHALARAGELTPKGQWVLDELLTHLSKSGRCDPSYERLAACAGCCSRTAQRAIATAADKGLLSWQRRLKRVAQDGEWRVAQDTNAYELLDPCGSEPHPLAPASRAINLESGSLASLSIAVIPTSTGVLPDAQLARILANVAEEKQRRRLREVAARRWK